MFRFIANLPVKWKLGLTTMLLTLPGCLLIIFPTKYSEYTPVFIILSGILLSIILNFFIAKPINRVVEVIREIAQGDLTKKVAVNSHDEVGKLAEAVNKMTEDMEQALSQVMTATRHVTRAAEELLSLSSEVAHGADSQKDQSTQVAAAMEQMATTVLQVSENSQKAAETAIKASQLAKKGSDIVGDTISTMNTIARSVGESATKIKELGERSSHIGEIISVIDEIADQTNLLALNAAIEAARAGDQGRGFAVVADEVRKLAERTTRATKEIAIMINSIQQETTTAVRLMEAGTKDVENGVGLVNRAGTSLDEILSMAEKVGDMITQIATASTEQSSATEQVTTSIEKIAAVTQESAGRAQQTAAASSELTAQAQQLQALVKQFKLKRGQEPVIQQSRRDLHTVGVEI